MKRISVRNYRVITVSLLLGLSLVGLSLMLARAPVSRAATITVTSDADSGPGSLRQAIIDAASGDTINFSLPASSTITLTSAELLINKNLTISNLGANLLTVQRSTAGGTPDFRIFDIADGNFNVTISGLTISNGNAPQFSGGGGGILNLSTGTVNIVNDTITGNSSQIGGDGGGINNGERTNTGFSLIGTVNITNCIISNNSATNFGGGIFSTVTDLNPTNTSTVNITNSTVSGNSAAVGGGVYNQDTQVSTFIVNVTNSTISGNSAASSTGGVYHEGNRLVLNITTSTISANSSGGGSVGAILNIGGTVNMTNSTISGNSAGATGGISNSGSGMVNITNSTISSNSRSVSGGGGITNDNSTANVVNVKNSIIAANSGGGSPDLSGTFTSQGYNLIGNNSGATITPTTGDQIGTPAAPTNPKLGSLQNNGGPTFTRALLSGSPAIDKGSAATGVTTDQRGFTRPVDNPAITNATGGDGSDIGAFEGQVPTVWPGTSTLIPGGIGNFTSLGGPSLSGTVIAFFGTGSGTQQGIYRAEPVGPPITIADTNTPIPNGTGNFLALHCPGGCLSPALSGSNVAFFGTGAGSQEGVYAQMNNTLRNIADTNTPIPGGTGNFLQLHCPGSCLTPATISGSNVAFFGMGSGGQQGIYRRAMPSGPPNKVADTNTAIPGGTGNFLQLSCPGGCTSPATISGSNVAFFGTGSGGQQGVYALMNNTLVKVVDTNTAIPGGIGNFSCPGGCSDPAFHCPGGCGSPSFNCPGGCGSPAIAFFGTGSGGQQGIYTAVPGGPPSKIADTNTAIPGGIGNFTGFGPVSISETDVTFLGTGSGGQTGLYDLTGGTLVKVVDMNTMINGNTITGKTITGLLFANTGLSGDPVAFTATFSDGSQNIYVSDVAPTSPTAAPANISGRVTTADGAPLPGVTMTLNGATTRQAITNSDGSYLFATVDPDNFYIVTPVRANYSFSPANRSFSLVGNRTDAVFTATADAAPAANPLDEDYFFVRQQYLDFLEREPDQGGLDYWSAQIRQCNGEQTCIHNKRIDVSNAFFFELEFQQTGAYVFRLDRAAFGNNQPFPNPDNSNQPEANELPSHAAFARDRARVVGGANLAQGQLDLANTFVGRPEFLAKYPASQDGPGFVDSVLATIQTDTGANLTSQRTALISLFNSGGRGSVMYRLADDNVQTNPVDNRPFIDAEYNRAFVFTQYAGYLGRDSDIGGFLFWLGQVSSGPLRDVTKQHGMVCAFITSTEYQRRFGSLVTHSNAECPQ